MRGCCRRPDARPGAQRAPGPGARRYQRPAGALCRVASIIGDAGGNIVEVHHQRLFHDVPLKMAELDVVLETRDRRHVDTIIAALIEAGFPTQLLSGSGEGDGDPLNAGIA